MKLYFLIIWTLTLLTTVGCGAFGDSGYNARASTASAKDSSTGLIEDLDPGPQDRGFKLQLPERHPRITSATSEPADVPEHFEDLEPVLAKITVRIESENASVESVRLVIRTLDRVYVDYQGQGQEWLFLRNPLDARRVSGHLVDHQERAVLHFYQSDLANAPIVRGWNDVITMGISIDALRATGEIQWHHGITFERYVSKGSVNEEEPQVEVWWSAEQALPWKISRTNAKGSWVQEIVELSRSFDSTLLEEPARRYPEYKALDVVDWREEHHDEIHGGP
jgi:hypothetical protein